jgi:hypothetical protein
MTNYFEEKQVPVEKIPGGTGEQQVSNAEIMEGTVQNFLDQYKRLFITFAGDDSLSFRIGSQFAIDLKEGRIFFDGRWFVDQKYSKKQIIWAILHEIGHFVDMKNDPESKRENDNHILKRAREIGEIMMKKWKQKYGKSDPEFIDRISRQEPISCGSSGSREKLNKVESTAYKFFHLFFNIFDDIFDNNLIRRMAPMYESTNKGGQEVKQLYREKLFEEIDYSKIPRHLQFLYKLLREEMVPDEEVIVNEEVKQIMDKKIVFQGKEYTPTEIIDSFIKPKKNRKTKLGLRNYILKNSLEPIFLVLLKQDLEEWVPQKNESSKGQKTSKQKDGNQEQEAKAQVNPWSEYYNQYDENNPDKFSNEDVNDWLDDNEAKEAARKKAEEAAKTEANKSNQQKAEEAQENMDRNWCSKNNIDYSNLLEFRKIENEVEAYLQGLLDIWKRIVYGASCFTEREMRGYFQTGNQLDINQAIREWPKIDKGNLEVKIMKRQEHVEKLVNKPELIRARIVCDLSGSMISKIHVLQQFYVLIMSSLREFQTHLNFTGGQTGTKLGVDTEAWIFGNHGKKIKSFRADLENQNQDMIEILRAFKYFGKCSGLTLDYLPLGEINRSLSDEEKRKIQNEEILEFVFVVTDGASTSPDKTIKQINRLVESAVVCKAFLIGQVEKKAENIFEMVWNEGREEKLGSIVGKEIGNLIPVIAELLKKLLSDIHL